ncbi:MAG TPA: aminodeoxychorismate synthase component I [Anaerolineales bacterium]|nr:aminodeoxychorismate synthase component I [Anaerolineales bacterium]
MIKINEVLLKDSHNWLHFANPCRLISAEELNDVVPALREIERLAKVNDWHAAGFISYEAAAAFDPALQTQPIAGFPYLWFGLYPQPRSVELPRPEQRNDVPNWQPTIDRETYNSAIAQIKEHIAEGKTYQVNYTMRLQADFTGNAWDFFLHLAQSQNDHAAYVDTGHYVICSASPELFFQLNGDTITCRPMKGTVGRGRTTREDNERSDWLKNSEKNRAENVMIVDMIRNDLGKIAKTGSVHVPRLFQTERYPTLWQMTSTVMAETNRPLTEIFTALFPSASITGAPKVSTMKIIRELESTPRKIYTGTIGYISPRQTASFNVAIRTALVDRKNQRAEYGVGGGIVWDSTSTDEYAEASLKARVLIEELSPFSLLETMLWTPHEGFFLCEKHLARLLDSASYFDIPLTKETLQEHLEQVSSRLDRSHRVRLFLDRAGQLTSDVIPFTPEADSKILNVRLANEPVDSNDIFLFHKTTRRAVHESAQAECEECDDVLLYNEAGELTEFTIGNLVVELNGQLLTPPIACGVLPGTFRAHLMETGQVAEGKIRVEQLKDCTKIFRINSIRKWQRVNLSELGLQ